MVNHEEGRWDVSIKNNAVCVERISDGDKRLFEDSLAPDEARELAGLLTKFADKLGESGHPDSSDESGGSDDSDKSDESDESDDSDKSGDSKKSEESAKSSD